MNETPTFQDDTSPDRANTLSDDHAAAISQSESGEVRFAIQNISDIESDIQLREAALKEKLFGDIVPYFVVTNVVVLIGTAILILAETYFSYVNASYSRLTSENILICLLTATTVQMGAIALRIGRSLFK